MASDPKPGSLWFDAHLDLACLAVCGRDLARPIAGVVGPFAPGCVSLPDLREAGVRFALGTIFIEQVGAEKSATGITPEQYLEGDVEGASRRGRAQMEVYQTWRDAGLIKLDFPECLRIDPGVGEIRGGMGVSEVRPESLARKSAAVAASDAALHTGILVEGADSIRSPDELPWWVERGVIACGLAWAKNSRYAMGNSVAPDVAVGLTDLGREMVGCLDSLGIVHDLSHLSQRATDDLLGITNQAVIATHSNCRELLGGELEGKNQRHLRDETIREIDRRGGIIGLNLFGLFLRKAPPHKGPGRPSIDDALRHVERICDLLGHKRSVGLGSDMDGGFGSDAMCVGIERPQHLARLAEALEARGWTADEIVGFTHLNWLRFWSRRCRDSAVKV